MPAIAISKPSLLQHAAKLGRHAHASPAPLGLLRRDKRSTSLSQVQAIGDSRILQLEGFCTAAVFLVLGFSLRPRGWCDRSLVEVQASNVHQRGVFARVRVPEGTVLGCYPGFARPASEMASKVQRNPAAQGYVFSLDNGWYLDPTDSAGRAHEGKLWLLADTTLAFANEPPPGMNTNIEFRDGDSPFEILFVANRDIAASEELLVDYGTQYDRRSYGSGSE